MKQNKNESILCIGEFLVFVASIFLLFNRGFLNNILRISIIGAIALIFILLSDSFYKAYNSKTSSKLSWLFGIILIALVYYTAGSLNMLGPYLTLEGANGSIFKATMAILVLLLSYLSVLKQHSKSYLLIVYASMLILIYYAGLSISLNIGYIFVILTSILMLINIIKKEGDLLKFSKYVSLVIFIYSIMMFKELEAIPLALLCLFSLLNILTIGYKDKQSIFNKFYYIFLGITIYQLLPFVNSYEYNVLIIGALTFSDFIYSYLNKENNISNKIVKVLYNSVYIYVLLNIQPIYLIPTITISSMILLSSLGSIILKNHNKIEGALFIFKLVVTMNVILVSLNVNYLKLYPIIISLIINMLLLLIYYIIKKEPIKKLIILLLLINLFLPIFNTPLSILEYILALVIIFIDYYLIVIKHNYMGIKKVLIDIAYIIINTILLNQLDLGYVKYIIMAIILLLVIANSLNNEFLLTASLLAFLYCGVQYISAIQVGLLGFVLKEILLISGIYIILKYIIKDHIESKTWFIILIDLLLIYNIFIDKNYILPVIVSVITIIYSLTKEHKVYNSVLILSAISFYLLFASYSISGYILLFVIGIFLIIYSMTNRDQVVYIKNLVNDALEENEDNTEVEIIEQDEVPRVFKKNEASYCVNCGNIMAGEDHFCRHCGYKKEDD